MNTLIEPDYLPADRSEVTESWLVETLASHPDFARDPIRGASLEHLGDGMGQLSSLLKADLDRASGTDQLVIKLHASVPDMHDIAVRYGHYESEINFYRHLADRIPVRTPETYVAQLDPGTHRVLVVMESFAHWHSPDQVEGASVDEVTIAAEHLAGLTAALWNVPAMQQYPWLRNLRSDAYASLADDYVENIDTCIERHHESFPSSAEPAARAIGSRYRAVMDELCLGNQALCHWDYRVENLFFGPADDLVVIDWQLMMMGNPAFDLAYLLSSNVVVEQRRKIEDDLITQFLEHLARRGVADYRREDLDRDFRGALLGVSCIPILGGASYDIENVRSGALFEAAGSRIFQAIEDWDALALLP